MICISGTYYEESKHFSNERAYRIQELEARIGYGSAFCTTPKNEECDYILTDTGILFVVNKTYHNIITAFIPSMTQTKALFEQAQMKLPKWYMKVIIRNQKWAL